MDWDNNRCGWRVSVASVSVCAQRSRPRPLLRGCDTCLPACHHATPLATPRAAAVLCQLQGEYDEELRFQFAHLAAAFPVPPAQRTTAQRDRLVATALELVGTYADGTPLESRRTALVAHVRGLARPRACHWRAGVS